MLNRKTVRAARARFVEALYTRHAVTGLRLGMDIVKTISARTGVPVAAIVADQGQDSLTYGAAKIRAHKAKKAWMDGADEYLRIISIEEVD